MFVFYYACVCKCELHVQMSELVYCENGGERRGVGKEE